MKKFITLLVVSYVLLIPSCTEDDTTNDTIFGTWQATEFVSTESVTYAKNDDYNPQITFEEGETYTLALDINNCVGSFNISAENIEISSPSCTEVCCDSDFSERFAELLDEVSELEITKNGDLYLYVPDWGYIILEKIE